MQGKLKKGTIVGPFISTTLQRLSVTNNQSTTEEAGSKKIEVQLNPELAEIVNPLLKQRNTRVKYDTSDLGFA